MALFMPMTRTFRGASAQQVWKDTRINEFQVAEFVIPNLKVDEPLLIYGGDVLQSLAVLQYTYNVVTLQQYSLRIDVQLYTLISPAVLSLSPQ